MCLTLGLNPRRMVVPAITDLDMDTFDEKKDSQAASPRGFFSEGVFYWEGKNLEEIRWIENWMFKRCLEVWRHWGWRWNSCANFNRAAQLLPGTVGYPTWSTFPFQFKGEATSSREKWWKLYIIKSRERGCVFSATIKVLTLVCSPLISWACSSNYLTILIQFYCLLMIIQVLAWVMYPVLLEMSCLRRHHLYSGILWTLMIPLVHSS